MTPDFFAFLALSLHIGGAIAAAWGILSLAARRMPALRRLPGLAAG